MPRWTPLRPPLQLRFWFQVKFGPECWEWQGSTHGNGYGRIYRDGRRQSAHRVAYELLVGPIPDGLYACHHCDNRLCVNPAHLFLGTHKDNMQDCLRKGRNVIASNPRMGVAAHKAWIDSPKSAKWRENLSRQRKEELRSGKRVVIRDAKGRIMGHRIT